MGKKLSEGKKAPITIKNLNDKKERQKLLKTLPRKKNGALDCPPKYAEGYGIDSTLDIL